MKKVLTFAVVAIIVTTSFAAMTSTNVEAAKPTRIFDYTQCIPSKYQYALYEDSRVIPHWNYISIIKSLYNNVPNGKSVRLDCRDINATDLKRLVAEVVKEDGGRFDFEPSTERPNSNRKSLALAFNPNGKNIGNVNVRYRIDSGKPIVIANNTSDYVTCKVGFNFYGERTHNPKNYAELGIPAGKTRNISYMPFNGETEIACNSISTPIVWRSMFIK